MAVPEGRTGNGLVVAFSWRMQLVGLVSLSFFGMAEHSCVPRSHASDCYSCGVFGQADCGCDLASLHRCWMVAHCGTSKEAAQC